MRGLSLPGPALEEARRVAEAVEADLDGLLADLQAWVNVDTPSGATEQLDRLAAILAHTGREYGLHTELQRATGSGLSFHGTVEGAGSAKVALLCHHDTVFPLDTTAGWSFSREGGHVRGPGVADMKGGIAVAIHAARHLAQGPRPFALVEVVSLPDEETRPARPAIVDRLRDFDAVFCMECGRPDGSVVSARKGGRWFRLHAAGRPSHAGVEPDAGRNAVMALAREAVRIAGLHHAREGLTLQVTQFQGGQGLNTVPGEASLTVDMRALTTTDLDWAMAEILQFGAHEDVTLSEENLGGPPPLERTPQIAALASAAIELGAGLGHRFGEMTTGGVSDGSWAASAGIPTLDGLGPVGGEDHTPFEYAETATFASRCGVVAGLVAALDAGLLAGL